MKDYNYLKMTVSKISVLTMIFSTIHFYTRHFSIFVYKAHAVVVFQYNACVFQYNACVFQYNACKYKYIYILSMCTYKQYTVWS